MKSDVKFQDGSKVKEEKWKYKIRRLVFSKCLFVLNQVVIRIELCLHKNPQRKCG